MSNQTAKFKSKVTLSKQSKILAASYIDPHKRGAFIRSQFPAFPRLALIHRHLRDMVGAAGVCRHQGIDGTATPDLVAGCAAPACRLGAGAAMDRCHPCRGG